MRRCGVGIGRWENFGNFEKKAHHDAEVESTERLWENFEHQVFDLLYVAKAPVKLILSPFEAPTVHFAPGKPGRINIWSTLWNRQAPLCSVLFARHFPPASSALD
jgi:hypothetical protein